MNVNNIYKKIEQHVKGLFNEAQHPNLIYHNLDHTLSVVEKTKEIAGHYNLVENDMLVLFAAAWFHDVGYMSAEPPTHEEKSVEIMGPIMKELTGDDNIVDNIAACIMVTKLINEPENLLQEIMCDADTYNLGTKDFKKTNKNVYQEYILQNGYVSEAEWNKKTLDLMENHQYYTSYCKDVLQARKQKNLKKIKSKVEKHLKEGGDGTIVTQQNNLTTKGIQTMLRLTSENHMKLSDMADGKANILISVNAIIISVILSVLLRKLQTDTYLAIPTVLFLAFSVVTIVISILATRPKLSQGTFSDMDVINKKTNLLFFGNFHKTSLVTYEKAMVKMMTDPNYLYSSLIKDIYYLGVVLGRKYKLIRLAYNIFMIGIIVSVLGFGLAVLLHTPVDGVITNSTGTPLD